MFGHYYESEEIKALRFLRDNDIRFSEEVENDLEVNPGQTITISFSILSLLINKVLEHDKLEEKFENIMREHKENYNHNRSNYY